MFTKLEQCSWINLEVARGPSTQKCFKGLAWSTWWCRTLYSSWQCKESHHCCCHGLLEPLAMGDSGTSIILTRCESMGLRSLRHSERTTARDPVQHKRWTYPCYRAVKTERLHRWKKVINKWVTILKVHKCCTPVNKTMSEISNCCQ